MSQQSIGTESQCFLGLCRSSINLQVHLVLGLWYPTSALVCRQSYSRSCNKAPAAWKVSGFGHLDAEMAETMMSLLKCLTVNGCKQLWIVPLLAKRADDSEWYAQLQAQSCPVDKTSHMSVRPWLVSQMRKVHPDHLVLVGLQLRCYIVRLAGVDAPMAVSHRCEST